MEDNFPGKNEKRKLNRLEGDFLVRTFRYFYSHRVLMSAVFLLIFLSGAIYTFVHPLYYESTTTFFFPLQSAGAGLLSSLGVGNLFGGAGNLNQYAVSILKSRTISQKVIEKYGEKLFGSDFHKSKTMVEKLEELEKYVEIKSEEGIIKIIATTRDPQLSADVANYYLKLYDEFAKEATLTLAKRQRNYIQEQLQKVESELHKDELELLAFQQKENVVEPKAELEAFLTYYGNIKSMAILSRVEQEEFRYQLKVMQEKLTQQALSQQKDLSITSQTDSPGVQIVYNKLLTKEIELASQLKTKTPSNPQIKAIQQEIESLRGILREKIGENLKDISTETSPILMDLYASVIAQKAKSEALDRVIGRIEKQMEKIPDLAFSYRRLERDVLIKEKIYALLQMELQKAKSEEARSEPEIQVLDMAVPADFKAKPVVKLYLLGFLLLAVFLSFTSAGIYDRVIYIRENIKREEAKFENSADS